MYARSMELGLLLFRRGCSWFILEIVRWWFGLPVEMVLMFLASLVCSRLRPVCAPHPLPALAAQLFRSRTFNVSVMRRFHHHWVWAVCRSYYHCCQIGLGCSPLEAGLLTVPLAVAAIGMKVLAGACWHASVIAACSSGCTVLLGHRAVALLVRGTGYAIVVIVLLTSYGTLLLAPVPRA